PGINLGFTSGVSLTNGILGGFATTNNTSDWASLNGSNSVIAYTGYTVAGNGADTSTWASTQNINLTADNTSPLSVASSKTINSLKISGAGATVNVAAGQGL